MARTRAHAAATVLLTVCLAPAIAGRSSERNLELMAEVLGVGSAAAGRAHSLLATPDGRVFSWGVGLRGQIGDGALTDRWSPVSVAGVGDVIAVAAGAVHSVALTRNGDVYAWGANASGRLGDGTQIRRPRPVRVPGLTGVRLIAAGLAHTLAVTTDGRVFAWGANESGQLGIGNRVMSLVPIQVAGLSDIVAIAAGDSHSLAAARDGRLFAWGGNSLSAIGDGTTTDRLLPVAVGLVDVVAVAAGAEHSLALLRSGAVYSWGRGANGELGTGSLLPASTPKRVPGVDASAISAGRHFSASIRRDQRVTTWGANASGQLGDGTTTRRLRPVAVTGLESVTMLALGDAHAIAVTASGDVRAWGEGTAGRLGLGSELDQRAPSGIADELLDWDGDDEEGPVDAIPPSIVATTNPPLNAGWMTTPITVTFACTDDVGLASCSSPVTIAQDGFAQEIVGTAVDQAGNRATVSVVVNMDLNPPLLSISQPQDAVVVEGPNIVVTGAALDLGAGITDVRCNGAAAELTGGVIRCAVQLQPGRNEIVLHAVDGVGHNASTAVTVTRAGLSTRLDLTPATRVATVNEVIALSLRDEFGAVVHLAEWRTSDESIVSLSDTDPPVVTAVGIGEATITAERDGLSATASIAVSATLEPGAVRWTLPPLQGFTSGPPLFVNRVDAASPHLFTVESVRLGEATLRAVTSEGEVLWQQHSPGVPLMGDSFGGVLAAALNANNDYRAYVRMGGGSARPWRFESPGTLGRPAQSWDGIIYTIEQLSGGLDIDGKQTWDKYATVLDGATGELISRTLMEPEVDQFISDRDGVVVNTTPPTLCRSTRYEHAPATLGPIAGADGRGYFVVRRYQVVKRANCTEPFGHRPARTIRMGLDLLSVSGTGEAEVTNLFSTECTGTLDLTIPCDLPVQAFQVMPDGVGGTLVTWERGTHMVGLSVFVQRSLTRVEADGAVERPVASNFRLEMIGQAGTAITFDAGWKGLDVTTGEVKWASALPNLAILAARPDGGLAALDMTTRELKITDANAQIESTQPFGLDWHAVHEFGDWIGIRGNALAAVIGDLSDATRWAASKGNAQGQLTTRRPGLGLFAKSHLVQQPFTAQHVSIRIAPTAQDFWQKLFPQHLVNRDTYGNLFMTLGAGTADGDTSLSCSGTLTKGINRSKDVAVPPLNLEQLPVAPFEEIRLINDLKAYFDNYADDLPYTCLPELHLGMYNSNSFASGLLIKAAAPLPVFPIRGTLVPGWPTPVPSFKFDRR